MLVAAENNLSISVVKQLAGIIFSIKLFEFRLFHIRDLHKYRIIRVQVQIFLCRL